MGTKGDKLSDRATISVEMLQKKIAHLGDIRSKKMFGGYGVFEADTMFALINKGGRIFFKADESNLQTFQEAGSVKHDRMPYYSLPEDVVENTIALEKWAKSSISVAKKAK